MRVGPREVRVLRVGRDGEDFDAELFKVGEALVEGEDLGRAHKGDCLRRLRSGPVTVVADGKKTSPQRGKAERNNVQSRG